MVRRSSWYTCMGRVGAYSLRRGGPRRNVAAGGASCRLPGVALSFDRVEARQVVKAYGPTIALAGVDLTLPAGEITAVEGPNGSGKSTLLSLLSLLSRPTRGQLRFGAYD